MVGDNTLQNRLEDPSAALGTHGFVPQAVEDQLLRDGPELASHLESLVIEPQRRHVARRGKKPKDRSKVLHVDELHPLTAQQDHRVVRGHELHRAAEPRARNAWLAASRASDRSP
ncbi:unnamed protein product [Prorocentrum cordatum]|uniref:Uncharacterized protein n=1 Tax=Prorocentrum cordatum TaxID=2364126 RepID=A0ABN9XRM4_9DINO|nr:unnamed protein product [Polarella glacialis]